MTTEINNLIDSTVRRLWDAVWREELGRQIVEQSDDARPEESYIGPFAEIRQINSTLTDGENTLIVDSQRSSFNDTQEGREVPTYEAGERSSRKANAPGGFHFPTGDRVWTVENFGRILQLGRLEGQIVLGATKAVIPAQQEGTIAILTADGNGKDVQAICWFDEEIGADVKVAAMFAPDGKAYIVAAACEEEAGGGGPYNPDA